MDLVFIYVNFIRIVVIVIAVICLCKRNYKKLAPAAIAIGLTFVPWILTLFNFQMNTLTEFLYYTVVIMAVYLGSGFRFYDSFAWWDRVIHFLSGVLFVSFAITLGGKLFDAKIAGKLIFCFTFSLALHVIWEVVEFIVDLIFHTDHQHWQKKSTVVNHQPKGAVQPPGLVDTMSDAISNIIGTIIACVGWWMYFAIQ